jgi:copper homeostasis protein
LGLSGVLIEVAVEDAACACRAAEDGAQRVELSADLSVGGVTPALDLVKEVRASVHVPLHILIRARGGDFVYSGGEVDQMCRDIEAVHGVGVDAVVIGALTADGEIDRSAMQKMKAAAGTLPVISHRAVDAAQDVAAAFEILTSLGIRRALTSGGAPGAEQGIPMLRRLVKDYGDRVTVLAGGLVRPSNVRRIVDETGVSEIHFGYTASAEPGRVRAVVAALSDIDG